MLRRLQRASVVAQGVMDPIDSTLGGGTLEKTKLTEFYSNKITEGKLETYMNTFLTRVSTPNPHWKTIITTSVECFPEMKDVEWPEGSLQRIRLMFLRVHRKLHTMIGIATDRVWELIAREIPTTAIMNGQEVATFQEEKIEQEVYVILIDTSGSMDNHMLPAFRNHIFEQLQPWLHTPHAHLVKVVSFPHNVVYTLVGFLNALPRMYFDGPNTNIIGALNTIRTMRVSCLLIITDGGITDVPTASLELVGQINWVLAPWADRSTATKHANVLRQLLRPGVPFTEIAMNEVKYVNSSVPNIEGRTVLCTFSIANFVLSPANLSAILHRVGDNPAFAGHLHSLLQYVWSTLCVSIEHALNDKGFQHLLRWCSGVSNYCIDIMENNPASVNTYSPIAGLAKSIRDKVSSDWSRYHLTISGQKLIDLTALFTSITTFNESARIIEQAQRTSDPVSHLVFPDFVIPPELLVLIKKWFREPHEAFPPGGLSAIVDLFNGSRFVREEQKGSFPVFASSSGVINTRLIAQLFPMAFGENYTIPLVGSFRLLLSILAYAFCRKITLPNWLFISLTQYLEHPIMLKLVDLSNDQNLTLHWLRVIMILKPRIQVDTSEITLRYLATVCRDYLNAIETKRIDCSGPRIVHKALPLKAMTPEDRATALFVRCNTNGRMLDYQGNPFPTEVCEILDMANPNDRKIIESFFDSAMNQSGAKWVHESFFMTAFLYPQNPDGSCVNEGKTPEEYKLQRNGSKPLTREGAMKSNLFAMREAHRLTNGPMAYVSDDEINAHIESIDNIWMVPLGHTEVEEKAINEALNSIDVARSQVVNTSVLLDRRAVFRHLMTTLPGSFKTLVRDYLAWETADQKTRLSLLDTLTMTLLTNETIENTPQQQLRPELMDVLASHTTNFLHIVNRTPRLGSYPAPSVVSNVDLPDEKEPSPPVLHDEREPVVQNRFAQSIEAMKAEIVCSITQENMTDPVSISCGHSFERSAIVEWLARNNTCPLCRNTLTTRNVTPNIVLRQIILSLEHI